MKNQSRITVDRMQEVHDLIEQIKKESYKQGYEDGKEVMEFEFAPQVEKVVEKSANQQRAELIQDAKDFVSDYISSDNSTYVRNGFLGNVEFHRKGNKITCVVVPYEKGIKRSVGRSVCSEGDVFNEHIGQAIALAKAKRLAVPKKFLEAVQPDVVVIGMKFFVAEVLPDATVHITHTSIRDKTVRLGYAKERIEQGFYHITEDTNAEY